MKPNVHVRLAESSPNLGMTGFVFCGGLFLISWVLPIDLLIGGSDVFFLLLAFAGPQV
jgi:hypothetical protein